MAHLFIYLYISEICCTICVVEMNNQSSISIVKCHCSIIKHNKTIFVCVCIFMYAACM